MVKKMKVDFSKVPTYSPFQLEVIAMYREYRDLFDDMEIDLKDLFNILTRAPEEVQSHFYSELSDRQMCKKMGIKWVPDGEWKRDEKR